VATAPQHLAYLRRNFERQVALGLQHVEMLSRDEVVRRVPQLRSDDILGGSFCATDGFVDPYSVMKGFMAAAAEHGARLWRGVTVTGIDVDAHGVARASAPANGNVAARTVVNAAGTLGRGGRPHGRVWISRLCRCAACWCPPNPSPACRIACRW
jgi:sarcosine oxidase, subunit beta